VIPGAFDYHRPTSVGDATRLLHELGDDVRVIAGWHSLIPMMKLRLVAPTHLVDLQDIAELNSITRDGDQLVIGAMITQHTLITDALVAEAVPLVREAVLQIADPQVRYVGTIGGNFANGDPGNDMPGVMQCLGAAFELTGPGGTRHVPARAFYEAAYVTALADDEILTRIRVPIPFEGHGHAYEKQKRKIGDYATAAAVLIQVEGGRCSATSIAMTNPASTPIWSEKAAAALVGSNLDTAAIAAAVTSMEGDIDPAQDNRGPIDFKRHVAGVMLRRAIARAASILGRRST
jgi:aerobic carbon-monoxide dehydrogenase medium subunit